MRRALRQTLALALIFAAAGSRDRATARADGPNGADPGRSWALLIGVEKYQKANPLRHTMNDVRRLAETLRDRGGLEPDSVLEITDDEPDAKAQPTRAALMETLPNWLAQVGPTDRLIVFFSGHGFRDPAGKLYLAPIDCDPANAAATGIPVEWFRQQIAGCKAGFKLLLLDACHAGSEKGDDEGTGVAAKDLGESFRDLSGVATLASSTADEKSQIWEEKQQSLFSYWLVQGLRGHADADGDGIVDIDELNKYVYANVTRTAKTHFPRPQTPVRIVRSGTRGVPMVLRLRPQGLKGLLNDVAEQLALAAEERKLNKVGVLEFTSETGVGELLGADFGLLGRWCAEELEKRLVRQGEGKFQVTDRRRLRTALAAQRFGVKDLGSEDALKQLSKRLGGMPALTLGTLRGRVGRVVTLQCKLVRTDSEELSGTAGGTAELTESEWAMLGRSVALAPEDRRPEMPTPDQPSRPMEDQVVARMDQRAKAPHPLSDPSFPFPIRIFVNGRPRPLIPRGADLYVPLRSGETYEIEVQNRPGRLACMRLLVDGLNTLPEPDDGTKGITTEVWGKRVSLDEARHYVLDPARGRAFRVRGFVTKTGSDGEVRRFTVTQAGRAKAVRHEFAEEMGIITAAFYDPAPGSRGPLVTDAGEALKQDLSERTGVKVGNLRAVVHVRYADASDLGYAGP